MSLLLILLAILPGIGVCLYIYTIDKYEKEHQIPLILSFLLGVLITFPVMKLQEWVIFLGLENPKHLLLTLFSSFVIVSLSEELIKLLAVLAYPFSRSFFNEPLDGIVYTVMVAMGFATLENVIYANRFGLETTILRAFTAIPAHAVFAVIMGYYVGLAKFDEEGRNRLLLTGLGLAVGVHGLYDFFILQQIYEGLMVLAILTLWICIYYARELIRQHQENSPFRKE